MKNLKLMTLTSFVFFFCFLTYGQSSCQDTVLKSTRVEYNDLLTHKSEIFIFQITSPNGGKYAYTITTNHFTWEWIVILVFCIICFVVRIRWNIFSDDIQGQIFIGVFIGLFVGLLVGMLVGLILFIGSKIGFEGIIFTGVLIGLFVGFFEEIQGWFTGLVIISFGSLLKILIQGEISWYSVLYIIIVLALSYGLGYLMKKNPKHIEIKKV